jgi:hypothetical protein
MISRRQILVASGGTVVAASLSWTTGLADSGMGRADGRALSAFLFDNSIDGVAGAASIARGAGVSVTAFRGDVGVPWLDVIEPMWRRSPQPIAGITHGGALFCLEHLARSYRLACTFRWTASDRLEAAAIALLRAAAHKAPAPRNVANETVDAPIAWLLQPTARNNQ